MIDVPENIKELIDSTVKEQFAAFEKMVNGNGDKNNGNKGVINNDTIVVSESLKDIHSEAFKNNDGVSAPVKHYLNDLQNNPFAGKDI